MNIPQQLKSIRTAEGKSLYDVELKRARITALVLGSSTVLSLIFLVFAFIQKSRTDQWKQEAEALRQQLEECKAK